MRRLLGLGDNTVDHYLSTDTIYPGGNAVNVAVLTARLGHEASYLGIVGTDAEGDLILRALREERVDVTHCRQIPGTTSWSAVRHDGNDRFFTGSDPGVSTRWDLTEADDAFIARHHITHTSLYSALEPHLPRIRRAAPLLSFDFTSEWTDAHLQRVAPLVDIAVLSAASVGTEDAEALARRVAHAGPEVVVVTRGPRGALALHADEPHHQAALPVTPLDTLGAGDAFIAGFLNTWLDTRDARAALHAGAREAARNCATRGAFGHGVPMSDSVARDEHAPEPTTSGTTGS